MPKKLLDWQRAYNFYGGQLFRRLKKSSSSRKTGGRRSFRKRSSRKGRRGKQSKMRRTRYRASSRKLAFVQAVREATMPKRLYSVMRKFILSCLANVQEMESCPPPYARADVMSLFNPNQQQAALEAAGLRSGIYPLDAGMIQDGSKIVFDWFNEQNLPAKLIGYECVPRNQMEGLDSPDDCLIRSGALQAGSGTSYTALDISKLGTTPFDAVLFCRTYKILKVTTRIIPGGGHYVHTLQSKKKKTVWWEQAGGNVEVGLGRDSRFIMWVVSGLQVGSAGGSGGLHNGSASLVGKVTTSFRWVENRTYPTKQNRVTAVLDTLTGAEQVIAPGTLAVTALATT